MAGVAVGTGQTEPVSTLDARLLAYYARLQAGERPDRDTPIDEDTPWEEMRQLAQEKDPSGAWRVVKRILPLVPDESLGYLAAGPIEDLIDFHCADFIEHIERLATDDNRFRLALTYLHIGPWVPDEIAERLRRAATE